MNRVIDRLQDFSDNYIDSRLVDIGTRPNDVDPDSRVKFKDLFGKKDMLGMANFYTRTALYTSAGVLIERQFNLSMQEVFNTLGRSHIWNDYHNFWLQYPNQLFVVVLIAMGALHLAQIRGKNNLDREIQQTAIGVRLSTLASLGERRPSLPPTV